VEHVVGAIPGCSVHVVNDEDETRDAIGHVAPRERRRNLIAGLRVLQRNLSAVGPCGGRQRHHRDAAAAAAAAARRRLRRRRSAALRVNVQRSRDDERA